MPGADAPRLTMRQPQARNTAFMQHEDAKRGILEDEQIDAKGVRA
jgi:hypothetical protein